MGHSHEPFEVPNPKIYDSYQQSPELIAHEKRLGRVGLKDPWIRNYAFMFQGAYRKDKWFGVKKIFRSGMFYGIGAAAALIAIEEGYTYMNYGHTSWNPPQSHH